MISYFLLLLFFVFDPDCQSFFFLSKSFCINIAFFVVVVAFSL